MAVPGSLGGEACAWDLKDAAQPLERPVPAGVVEVFTEALRMLNDLVIYLATRTSAKFQSTDLTTSRPMQGSD